MLSNTAFRSVAESDRAHNKFWSDVSELNYWARRLNFQKLNEKSGFLEEVYSKKFLNDWSNEVQKRLNKLEVNNL